MRWIRIWIEETLKGTTFNELDIKERGIWFSLLVMAGASLTPGVVEIRKGVPWPLELLAVYLNCELGDLEAGLEKLKEVGKVKLLPDGRIEIVNWKKYQTVYETYYKKNDKNDADKETEPAKDYKSLPLDKKRVIINGIIDKIVKELRREYPITIRLVPKTKIRMGNILHTLAESENSIEKAAELFKDAWAVYYRTGRQGKGSWAKWVNEKKFSFAYFLSVIQYFIDAVVRGAEMLTEEDNRTVTKISESFEDFGDEPF